MLREEHKGKLTHSVEVLSRSVCLVVRGSEESNRVKGVKNTYSEEDDASYSLRHAESGVESRGNSKWILFQMMEQTPLTKFKLLLHLPKYLP